MDVASFQFLGFALAAGLIYNLRQSLGWRYTVLLTADVAFLSSFGFNWKGYVPLVAFLAMGFAGIRLLQRRAYSRIFPLVIACVVFLYIWLKQYTFLPSTMFLHFSYLTIGLSYIFFRVAHMVIDANEGALPDRIHLIQYLTYTLNFSTIAAGPIQLYPDFAASQFQPVRPRLTIHQCGIALERMAIGFFKLKMLSTMLLALHQWAVGNLLARYGVGTRLAVACLILGGYPVYLYCNFSGFIDLTIGLSRFFCLDLPENFDRPFSATSFMEFWNRWHITLSRWLKTYVYTPFVKVMMHRFPNPELEPFLGVMGFFVTFFLVGVWHGQTSEFLCFGLLQGGGVSLNKVYQIEMTKGLGRKRYRQIEGNFLYRFIARGLTFTYFAFTLMWFWSSWSQLHRLSTVMSFAQMAAATLTVWLTSSVALGIWEVVRERSQNLKWDGVPVLGSPAVRAAWAVYVAVITLIALGITTVSTPVLYQIF